jgi:hypothetical protein
MEVFLNAEQGISPSTRAVEFKYRGEGKLEQTPGRTP